MALAFTGRLIIRFNCWNLGSGTMLCESRLKTAGSKQRALWRYAYSQLPTNAKWFRKLYAFSVTSKYEDKFESPPDIAGRTGVIARSDAITVYFQQLVT